MPSLKTSKIMVSLTAVGFSAVVTQLILIREGISTFGGNELVIGLILGLWLLSTASGACLGARLVARGKKFAPLLFAGHLLLAVIPFLQLAAFRALPLLWIRGELPGIGSAIIGSSLILFPYGLISGAMIPLEAGLLSSRGTPSLHQNALSKNTPPKNTPSQNTPSAVYIIDLGGEILGGLLFSFIFVYFFSHWGVLVAVGLVNLGVAMLLSAPTWWPVLIFLCLALFFSFRFNLSTLTWQVPGQEILLHKNTPFSQLTITRSGQQINVLSDGIPLFSTGDYRAEALGHIPLIQVGPESRVLLISGGVFGSLSEILKHNPSRIDYVELDPAILALDTGNMNGQICKSLRDPRVHTHVSDGRLFIKKARHKQIHYDCVILNLPDPENIQLNRFYTEEFFQEARDVLSPQGVLFFTLTGADNYLESEGLGLNRSVYAALARVFPHVLLFPGETHYFLAALTSLDFNISSIKKTLAERKIKTRWLVDYQLPEMTDPFRIDWIRDLVDVQGHAANTDLSPLAFRHLLNLWLKKSGGMGWLVPAVIVLVVIFAFLACKRDRLLLVTFSSGYAGICLELSLLFIFQIIFGYVYLWISLFVTLFMIGLVSGALAARRWRKDPVRQTVFQDFILIILVGLVFGLAVSSRRSDASLSLIQFGIIPLILFGSSLAVGWQFVAISHQLGGKAAQITGRLYLADLAGASCGTVLTSLFLLPQFGIPGVLLSAALVKLISLVVFSQIQMRKAR